MCIIDMIIPDKDKQQYKNEHKINLLRVTAKIYIIIFILR